MPSEKLGQRCQTGIAEEMGNVEIVERGPTYQVPTTVHYAKLRGEYDGADEGEEGGEAVESEGDDRDAEGGGEVGDDAVEHGDPGQGADEHDEVQSSVRNVAPVRRHNIAYQCRRQQYPKELHQAQDRLHELHGLTVTVLPEVAGKCCGRYTTLCWQ